MRIYQLDDDYSSSRKKLWSKAFKIALFFVGILWAVFLLNAIIPIVFPYMDISRYGIHPRHINSLFGIVSTIFLHGSLSHIISNTLPLLLAITALFGNYPKMAKRVFFYSILLTGILVWSFARSANHIGASGLLYCLLAYIFVSGFIRKDILSIGLSLVIAFLYGSLIFGIIPDKEHISWESHLFGLVSGVFLAWLYRRRDMPIYKSYDEEE